MPDANAYRAILNAEVANALIVMIIVTVVALVLLARIFTPIFRQHNQELELIRQAIEGDKETSEAQTQAIHDLQNRLDQHVVSINVRFDKLPQEIRAALGAEVAKRYSQRSFFSRLFGP